MIQLHVDRSNGRVARTVSLHMVVVLCAFFALMGACAMLFTQSTFCSQSITEAIDLSRELTRARHDQVLLEPFTLSGLSISTNELRAVADSVLARGARGDTAAIHWVRR